MSRERGGIREGGCTAIIVPCHNSGDFLERTVASVREQDETRWELVLVDDGSSDGTAGRVMEIARGDSRIRAIVKSRGGTCDSRNVGVRAISEEADSLLFLDHDDWLAPEFLGVTRRYLGEHPEAGLVMCNYWGVREGRAPFAVRANRWVPGRPLPRRLRDDERVTPFVTFYCGTGVGPFALYRRSVFERVGGWDEKFWPHEDTDLACRIALASEVHFVPDRLYYKRFHAGQGVSDHGRVGLAYGRFRAKWDAWVARDAAEAAVLERARWHYVSTHRPLRDLRVLVSALQEFVKRPSRYRASWVWGLAKGAWEGLVLTRLRRSAGVWRR